MFKSFFYSLFLYTKRLKFYSFLYIFTLFIIVLILGLSLYFINNISLFSEKVKSVTPENRIKIVLKDEGIKKKNGGIFSLFSKDNIIKKEKNFIKPDTVKKIESIRGVKSTIKLYNIDFPVSVYFSIPGSSNYFNAEIVGIGIDSNYAKSFVRKGDFIYKEGKEVPILIASYLIEVFNSIFEANNFPLKLTKENVLGFTFNIVVGSSFMVGGKPLDNLRCKVVGFIDMDYTMGIAVPSELVAKYKKYYWSNFKNNYFDFLISYIDIKEYNTIEKELDRLGLKIKKSDNLFNKISDIINTILEVLKITVTLVFFVIGVLGIIGIIYTLIFMLKGRRTEFYIYNFFGGINITSFLFWGYISILNFIVVFINYFIIEYFIGLVSKSISKVDIYNFIELDNILKSILSYSPGFGLNYSIKVFLIFEVISFIVIYIYNLFLVRKET